MRSNSPHPGTKWSDWWFMSLLFRFNPFRIIGIIHLWHLARPTIPKHREGLNAVNRKIEIGTRKYQNSRALGTPRAWLWSLVIGKATSFYLRWGQQVNRSQIFSSSLLLILEKFPIGGHRARKAAQFSVINHFELKYMMLAHHQVVPSWRLDNDFGPFKLQKVRKGKVKASW